MQYSRDEYLSCVKCLFKIITKLLLRLPNAVFFKGCICVTFSLVHRTADSPCLLLYSLLSCMCGLIPYLSPIVPSLTWAQTCYFAVSLLLKSEWLGITNPWGAVTTCSWNRDVELRLKVTPDFWILNVRLAQELLSGHVMLWRGKAQV